MLLAVFVSVTVALTRSRPMVRAGQPHSALLVGVYMLKCSTFDRADDLRHGPPTVVWY